MGAPSKHATTKLIIGFISSDTRLFESAKKILKRKFGPVESESEIFDFGHTDYYRDEMGEGLKKIFIVFKRPVSMSKNYRIKLYTNKLERIISLGRKRRINIDPGYMGLSSFALFTTKNRGHRIYVDKGIYAEVELLFDGGTFRPLEWTYPDYRTKKYIDFFNSVRKTYLCEMRQKRSGI